MKIKRIEHVAIATDDLQEVMEMFENKLGLKLEYQEDFPQYKTQIAMYPVGETYLEILQGTAESSDVSKWIERRGQGLYHICLEVEDIDGALAELKGKGVAFLSEEPKRGHGNSRVIFLDPESTSGLLIELAELPAEAH